MGRMSGAALAAVLTASAPAQAQALTVTGATFLSPVGAFDPDGEITKSASVQLRPTAPGADSVGALLPTQAKGHFNLGAAQLAEAVETRIGGVILDNRLGELEATATIDWLVRGNAATDGSTSVLTGGALRLEMIPPDRIPPDLAPESLIAEARNPVVTPPRRHQHHPARGVPQGRDQHPAGLAGHHPGPGLDRRAAARGLGGHGGKGAWRLGQRGRRHEHDPGRPRLRVAAARARAARRRSDGHPGASGIGGTGAGLGGARSRIAVAPPGRAGGPGAGRTALAHMMNESLPSTQRPFI